MVLEYLHRLGPFFAVNVGKYSIHGASGIVSLIFYTSFSTLRPCGDFDQGQLVTGGTLEALDQVDQDLSLEELARKKPIEQKVGWLFF